MPAILCLASMVDTKQTPFIPRRDLCPTVGLKRDWAWIEARSQQANAMERYTQFVAIPTRH